MVLGLLKPILNLLVSPAASNAPPQSAVARAAAARAAQEAEARQAAAQQAAPQTNSRPGQPEGVRFDLSDKALTLVEAASASAPAAASAQAQAPAVAPVQATPVQAASASASAPARTSAGSAPAVAELPAADSTGSAREPDAPNPSEEERARAWAIRGMERERLLSLVETLKVTLKADPAQKEAAESAAARPALQASATAP